MLLTRLLLFCFVFLPFSLPSPFSIAQFYVLFEELTSILMRTSLSALTEWIHNNADTSSFLFLFVRLFSNLILHHHFINTVTTFQNIPNYFIKNLRGYTELKIINRGKLSFKEKEDQKTMVKVLGFYKGLQEKLWIHRCHFINNLGSNFSRTGVQGSKDPKSCQFFNQTASKHFFGNICLDFLKGDYWKFLDISPDQFISLFYLFYHRIVLYFIYYSFLRGGGSDKSENHPIAGNVKARKMKESSAPDCYHVSFGGKYCISFSDLSAARLSTIQPDTYFLFPPNFCAFQ